MRVKGHFKKLRGTTKGVYAGIHLQSHVAGLADCVLTCIAVFPGTEVCFLHYPYALLGPYSHKPSLAFTLSL